MVIKKKTKKAAAKPAKKVKFVKEEDEEEGMGLDDAFDDTEGVEYAESKPRKAKKKDQDEESDDEDGVSEDELEEEVSEIENGNGKEDFGDEIEIKSSKPIFKVKKGDKMIIDGKEYEVDSHYVLIDHKTTKEMAVELFDPATDKDYQLRYFDDQVNTTLEFYELQEIMFVRRQIKKISW